MNDNFALTTTWNHPEFINLLPVWCGTITMAPHMLWSFVVGNQTSHGVPDEKFIGGKHERLKHLTALNYLHTSTVLFLNPAKIAMQKLQQWTRCSRVATAANNAKNWMFKKQLQYFVPNNNKKNVVMKMKCSYYYTDVWPLCHVHVSCLYVRMSMCSRLQCLNIYEEYGMESITHVMI